ncbi:MAG: hypothetical protein CMP41_00690 [Rickettsiales bacterium]|nr:hypothetical protein [Rickettsiales bacterium]
MKKEILLLLFLMAGGFTVYNFIPFPEEFSKNDSQFYDGKENEDSEVYNTIENSSNSNLLSFDIVRINRSGDVVIAGRSKPNERIKLFDGEMKLANIVADANGEWVWTSETPLKHGTKRLFLEYIDENGKLYRSEQAIVIFLDKNKSQEPLIVKSYTKGNKNSSLLNLEPIDEGIVLDLVEYSPKGNLLLSGRSEVNSELTFFIDNNVLGTVKSDEDGFWNFYSQDDITFGEFELRIDLASKNNGSFSLITSVFKEKLDKLVDASKKGSFVVQPGNSLWRIARRTMGGGIFYTEIYKNNLSQIKDPDLIFPGQIFEIPIITGKVSNEK